MVVQPRLDPVRSEVAVPSAVVWINRRQAVVAAISHDGRLRTCEITRGWLPEAGYLATVIRVIGDPQRVMILGPGSVRLALERAYVACQRHPDRLVDVEPAGATSADDLVGRVRALAARPQA